MRLQADGIDLLEAERDLLQIVERVSRGEQVGITRHGRLVAVLIPAHSQLTLQEIFDGMERIRRRVRSKSKVKELIESGRT